MNSPLKNMGIVVTRDVGQAGNFSLLLQLQGAHIIAVPVIKITHPDNWAETDNELKRLEQYDWIIFSSANSVDYFMKRLQSNHLNIENKNIGVVGENTALTLKTYGLHPTIMPGTFSASELQKKLKKMNMSQVKILFPCSNKALSEIPDSLNDAGARVKKLVVYQNQLNTTVDLNPFYQALNEDKIHCITFFSPSAVHNFAQLLGTENVKHIKENKITIASIGPTTRKSIEAIGLTADIIPKVSTAESMAEAIINHYEQQ